MFPKKELNFDLPHLLGKLSLDLRTRLKGTIERTLPYYKLKVIFRFKCRLNIRFQFKDSHEKKIRSRIICRYTCSNAKLLIMEKPFATFILEQLNTCRSPNLRENTLKMSNSLYI